MNKISFVIHAKHTHNGRLISKIRKAFGLEYEVIFCFTEFPGHAIELAKEAALSGSKFIIAASGDGTLNEIVNGVMSSGKMETCVGLYPLGTGNDFARTARVGRDLESLKELIGSGRVKNIDLGLISYKKPDNSDAKRHFINIADIGMGGFISQKLAGTSKWMGASITFQRAIISTFLSYRPQRIKLKADSFSYEGEILSLVMANGKYFGGGLGIAPDANPEDGALAVVLAGKISLLDYILNLGRIRKCKKIDHPGITYHTARKIFIETPERKLPVDMDGEFVGYTPLTVEIVPRTLKFICPA